MGRAFFYGEMLWCAHSGTGAAFVLTGPGATITLAGDPGLAGGFPRFAVFVDGRRVVDELLSESRRSYKIENPAAKNGGALVEIIKLSESAVSVFAIELISTGPDGAISPAPERALFVEFIGDSITCGYGIDNEGADKPFSTATQDCVKAYAFKAAEALGADLSLVAASGYGVVSGFTSGHKSEGNTIPGVYDKVGITRKAASGFDASETIWDFGGRKTDYVVINLGTNDNSYTRGLAKLEAEFAEAYLAFLLRVREHNPEATIICALGIMGDHLFEPIMAAVDAYVNLTGDGRIAAFKFGPRGGGEGFASDGHPTEATNERAALELTEFIRGLADSRN